MRPDASPSRQLPALFAGGTVEHGSEDPDEQLVALLLGALLTRLRAVPVAVPGTGALLPLPAESSSSRPAMSVAEAAAALGISRALAYDLVRQGEIPSVRLGRRIVVPRIAVEQLLRQSLPRPR